MLRQLCLLHSPSVKTAETSLNLYQSKETNAVLFQNKAFLFDLGSGPKVCRDF